MKRKSRLRLFVFTEFCPDYTGGLAIAIAENETEARAQILKVHGYNPAYWGILKVYLLTRKMAVSVSGGS